MLRRLDPKARPAFFVGTGQSLQGAAVDQELELHRRAAGKALDGIVGEAVPAHDRATQLEPGQADADRALVGGVPEATAYRRPRVEPKLKIEAYDQLRLAVAKEIQRIDLALKEPGGKTN